MCLELPFHIWCESVVQLLCEWRIPRVLWNKVLRLAYGTFAYAWPTIADGGAWPTIKDGGSDCDTPWKVYLMASSEGYHW